MAVEDADDLAIFFDADDFGVVATITPNTVAGDGGHALVDDNGLPIAADGVLTVSGILDRPSVERGVQHDNQFNRNSQPVVGQSPVFRGPTSLLSGVKAGATIVIGTETWSVYSNKPDGLGSSFLTLKKLA